MAKVIKSEGIRKPQILIVDDEVAMVRSLELLLRPLGQIFKAYSVSEAEEVLARGEMIDCIVTDVSMPEASGLELLDKIRRSAPEIPVVVMTAYSSVPQAVEAMSRGAFKYLVKPFENSEMTSVVERAISKKGIQYGESRSLPRGWVCNSRSMKEFILKAEKLTQSLSLLLLGEVGVGKSRAARWIHELSARSKREFLSVDGRAHEEDSQLLQAPLDKVGTIFVAEAFCLSKRLQDRLMEILEAQKVAVIVSSSADPDFQTLPDFRRDLFEKLTTLSLKVPSLKERPEDFDALCELLLMELSQRLKIPALSLDSSALEKLRGHTFAGNFEELSGVLERAALESRGAVISEDSIRFSQADLRTILPFTIPVEEGWRRLELLHEALESELIRRALEKYPDCSNTQIAAILGTTRRILELRMKEYQIRETS